MDSNKKQPKAIASVQKALKVISCFDEVHAELSLAELCAMTGIPKTTLFGLAYTLLNEGYLEKCKNANRFRLGVKIMEVAFYLKQSLSITHIAAPILDRICHQTQQNIYLTTHRYGTLFFLENCYSDREYINYSSAGKVIPIHCSASGKAMMSHMSKEQVEKIVSTRGLPPSTVNSVTDKETLFQQLDVIRKQGYALDNEEETIGVRCIAVPILDNQGKPVGALSASGTVLSFQDEKVPEYFDLLNRQGRYLSLNAELFPYVFLP